MSNNRTHRLRESNRMLMAIVSVAAFLLSTLHSPVSACDIASLEMAVLDSSSLAESLESLLREEVGFKEYEKFTQWAFKYARPSEYDNSQAANELDKMKNMFINNEGTLDRIQSLLHDDQPVDHPGCTAGHIYLYPPNTFPQLIRSLNVVAMFVAVSYVENINSIIISTKALDIILSLQEFAAHSIGGVYGVRISMSILSVTAYYIAYFAPSDAQGNPNEGMTVAMNRISQAKSELSLQNSAGEMMECMALAIASSDAVVLLKQLHTGQLEQRSRDDIQKTYFQRIREDPIAEDDFTIEDTSRKILLTMMSSLWQLPKLDLAEIKVMRKKYYDSHDSILADLMYFSMQSVYGYRASETRLEFLLNSIAHESGVIHE